MLMLFRKIYLIFALLVLAFVPAGAQHLLNDEHAQPGVEHAEEKFNAGEYVIDHVADSYDWHILSFRNTHISIPLPVILYSKRPELHDGKAFHVFLSSKFHHGHDAYEGFKISHSKEFNKKIVELGPGGEEVGTPLDFSITKSIAGVFVSVIVLFWLLLSVAASAKRNKGKAPHGMQNLLEPLILFIRNEVAKPAIGNEKYEKFMPFLLTVFFFILVNNLMGLIPIPPFGSNVTGNISVTLVLALFTFFVTTINGNKHYWKEIYNPDVPWWMKFPIPLMPVVELSGVITKPFVLMIRLFANMLAGHLIVTVILSLIFIFASIMGPGAGFAISPLSVAFTVFIVLLDVLVSFIQAYVFTLLSALYFGMATAEHH